ncbi:hypothetical protein TRFO_12810 [Tritrichomonas foetus]|uniref:Ras-GEF domain-containing protein n=1 Tax=Tritrichomonas foetus TaxID=1144522 RepID=A0A1J4L091_9EUKA|nr:hypothetical protein TRFO_12810 [Tritrichomonas foetus]|eukprot:OHT16929.1 hypothetical protein TRFO_12810 [Tritrichomonas foetus]
MSEDSGRRSRNPDRRRDRLGSTSSRDNDEQQSGKSKSSTTRNLVGDNDNIRHSRSLSSSSSKIERNTRRNNISDSDSESDNEIPHIVSRSNTKYAQNSKTSKTRNTKNSNKEKSFAETMPSNNSTIPTSSRRNRSVNPHAKRTTSSENSKNTSIENYEMNNHNDRDNNKSEHHIENVDLNDTITSPVRSSRNSRSHSNIISSSNKSRRNSHISEHDTSSNSNNSSNTGRNRNKSSSSFTNNNLSLSLTNEISIEHYYKEERPQPFTGTLVSRFNGRTMKSSLKQDDYLQYVTPIIPGPTYLASLAKDTKPRSHSPPVQSQSQSQIEHQSSKNSKANQSSIQISEKERPRSRSVSQKSDALVSNLFVDDDPITSFNFDFATAYTCEHDEVIDEHGALNYFPSIEEIESSKINFNDDQKSVVSKLLSIFHQENIPQEYMSLTKAVSPYKNDILISNNRRNRIIEAISMTSFFEFRFGSDITEFAPDRLHIFTWHNLGIPSSQIAKNLLYFFGSLRDAANIKTPIKALSQYIVVWIKYFPSDFGQDSACADHILQLLKTMATRSKASISFINVVGSIIVDLHNGTIHPEDIYVPLNPPIFKDIAKVNYLINLSLDPYILAQHFAYIDLGLIHKLQRNEFVHNNWNDEKKNSTPLFNKLMNRFNETVSFIAASILIESEKRRARNISYWIKMMYYARRVHNYNLLAIIDAGLSCFPIKRLQNSWKMVNDNALIAFSRLHNFFKKPENQHEMIADPKKTIPFLGIFLTQLSQIDLDSTKTTLKSGQGAYDLNVQRKCLNIVDQIFYPWGTEIELDIDEKLLKECLLLTGKAKQPKDLIIPSISYEPARSDEKEILSEYLIRW